MTDGRPESVLKITDTNTGDYGRPFGTYAEIVKRSAQNHLESRGLQPSPWLIDALYMQHMQSLPTYREISKRRARLSEEKPGAPAVDFTEPELRAIAERFAMANDPDSQRICQKIATLLQALGAW